MYTVLSEGHDFRKRNIELIHNFVLTL